jgi:hypothetical protein
VDPKRSPRGGRGALPSPLPAAGGAAARGGAASAAGGVQGLGLGPGLGQGQAKTPGLAESIDRLAADVQQLRVDFERFFSGALHHPPEELRHRIQAQLRQLRNASAMTAVDRFRLGDLEARHNSYNELFSRRLREREEGRPRAGTLKSATPPPAHPTSLTPLKPLKSPPPAPPSRYDPQAGIVIGRSPDPGAVAALYEGLTAVTAGQGGAPLAGVTGSTVGSDSAGGAAAGPRFDLASFGSYLQRQAAAIRDKTGCEDVQFRLAAEDGKLKLKARPVGGASCPRPRQ